MKQGIQASIDYQKVSEAIQHYKARGYEYVEVPWTIGKEAYHITSEDHQQVKSILGYHVASAEQSFLELMLKGELSPGLYQACSPCFRDDPVGELYDSGFLKVELIEVLPEHITKEEQTKRTDRILADAKEFFSKYTPVQIVETPIGKDIENHNIEIGSYGYREYQSLSWIYGTGLAEPRFSYTLSKKPKGYHLQDIAKHAIGTFEKIKEEIQEGQDALTQKNKIMNLIELSDTIGAIEQYLEKTYGSTITLEDVLTMKDATKRAFASRRRS